MLTAAKKTTCKLQFRKPFCVVCTSISLFLEEILDTESSHFLSKSVQGGSWFQEDLKLSNLYVSCIIQPLLISETRDFTKTRLAHGKATIWVRTMLCQGVVSTQAVKLTGVSGRMLVGSHQLCIRQPGRSECTFLYVGSCWKGWMSIVRSLGLDWEPDRVWRFPLIVLLTTGMSCAWMEFLSSV